MAVDTYRRARGATLLSWVALLLVQSAWLLPDAATAGGMAVLVGTVLPPLLPLHGLWRGRRRTYRWAALTLAPAMAWSLTELVANPAVRGTAVLSAMLAFLSLAAVVATLRTMPAGR